MAEGKFPKPYINTVKKDDSTMVYVKSFDNLDIGARPSGQPKSVSSGPKSIEHVGGTTSSNGGK